VEHLTEHQTIKLLLKVLATPTSVLTESQMLGVLELSGIVRNPVALKALQFASAQASASTPTTLVGFATTLQNLIKLNPDHKPEDYAQLEAFIKQITAAGVDQPLTFGMFLTLLDQLPPRPLVPVKPPTASTTAAAPAVIHRRRKRAARKSVKKAA